MGIIDISWVSSEKDAKNTFYGYHKDFSDSLFEKLPKIEIIEDFREIIKLWGFKCLLLDANTQFVPRFLWNFNHLDNNVPMQFFNVLKTWLAIAENYTFFDQHSQSYQKCQYTGILLNFLEFQVYFLLLNGFRLEDMHFRKKRRLYNVIKS